MQKARSRLPSVSPTPPRTPLAQAPSANQPLAVAAPRAKRLSDAHQSRLLKYLKYLPLLLPAAAAYALLWYLMNHYYPAQLANIPFTGSFGAVMAPFAVGTFFLLSYVLLNSRLSFFLTLSLSIVFFLRLHGADL